MSFWDNNKDSIKSGSLSVLKGAGRATKAVSKAGYSAYKSHNNNKHSGGKDGEGEEDDDDNPGHSYVGTINYRDPKSFPPPPHHVGAYGHAEAIPGVPPQTAAVGYQQPPTQQPQSQYPPYGQQPQQTPAAPAYNQYSQYGQQQQQIPPPTPTYGQQQQPVVAPVYGQQQHQQSLPPRTLSYGQQPTSLPSIPPSYGQQPTPPNSVTPGYAQPVQQPTPAPYTQQQQQQQPSPYYAQPSTTSVYGQQQTPPATVPTPVYGQQQQSSLQAPAPPARALPPPPTPYTQQPVQSAYTQPQQQQQQQQQQIVPPPAPAATTPQPYGQQQVYGQPETAKSTPPDTLNYEHPYHPVVQEQPQQTSYGNPPIPPIQSTPSSSTASMYGSVSRPPATIPTSTPASSYPQEQLNYVDPEPYNPNPATTPGYPQYAQSSTTPSQSYPKPPSRTSTSIPAVPQRTASTVESNVATNGKSNNPNEETIVEPKFKTNLMDFDLSKFGAPPPKARLTKEEEIKNERRKADAQRLKQIKEQSLQKARDTAAKVASPYGSTFPSAVTSNVGSANASTDQLNHIPTGSTEDVEVASTSRPVPGIPPRTEQPENSTPPGFRLPDISKFQPPPLSHHVARPESPAQTLPANRQYQEEPEFEPVPAYSEFPDTSTSIPHVVKQKPPKPIKKFQQSEQPVTSSPTSTSSPVTKSVYERPAMALPPDNEQPIIKKTPPPKPMKFTHSALPTSTTTNDLSDVHSKPKKVPPPKPPKPGKPAKPSKPVSLASGHSFESNPTTNGSHDHTEVESTARGSHIRELQARLGNLNL